jgi:hypothetical protein
MSSSPIILIACSRSKLSHPAPAREFYTGQLFKCALKFVDHFNVPFYILSAKYGWLLPEEIVEPYNVKIPRRGAYSGEFPQGSGFYIGPVQYFKKAPERYRPLVPYYFNRGTLCWQRHMLNMIEGIGCPHGFTAEMKYPCPRCHAS